MKQRLILITLFCVFFIFIVGDVFSAEDQDTMSHFAQAYKVRDSGEHFDNGSESQPQKIDYDALVKSALSRCKLVEYGNTLPFPAAAISLKGVFFVNNGKAKWLPPDPGKPGKNSIIGIDKDGDCVRDDIELLIARLLPRSSQKKARRYMFEYAKWLREFLRYSQLSENTAKAISRELYKSSECARKYIGDKNESLLIIDKVFSKFHNTYPRSYRYIRNNALLGGWTTREKINVSCH